MFQGVSADVDAMMWQEMMGVSKEEKKKKRNKIKNIMIVILLVLMRLERETILAQ